MQTGEKVLLHDFIKTIQSGSTVTAVAWDYKAGKWIYISPVTLKRFDDIVLPVYTQGERGLSFDKLLDMNTICPTNEFYMPLVRKR